MGVQEVRDAVMQITARGSGWEGKVGEYALNVVDDIADGRATIDSVASFVVAWMGMAKLFENQSAPLESLIVGFLTSTKGEN